MRIDPRELKITQTGAIFFALVNQGFASMSSLRVFIDERAVFEHESKRGAYGAAAYFATKSAAEAPFQLGFATVFAAIAYALIGLKWTAAAFTQHLTVLSLATLVAESLALAVGAAAADAKTAVVLCPVALSTSLLFGGFLVKLETLPALLKPLQHLSFFKHAFAVLILDSTKRPRSFLYAPSRRASRRDPRTPSLSRERERERERERAKERPVRASPQALLKIEFTGLVFECSAADKAALSDRLVPITSRPESPRLRLPRPHAASKRAALSRHSLGVEPSLSRFRRRDSPARDKETAF